MEMRKLKMTLLLCCFLTVGIGHVSSVNAQPTDCIPGDADAGVPDYCIPIDGGLSLLLAAGLGYGLARNRSNRQNGKEKQPTASE
jgi:hypothetical protein